jgi:hypothetical protein
MKSLKHLLAAIVMLFFVILFVASSATKSYQVFKAESENGTVTQSAITFEDNNCRIEYDLWKEGGEIGFYCYNKTDNNLTIVLDKTFFVLNGIAYDYYLDRSYAHSTNVGAVVNSTSSALTKSTGKTISSGFTTTYFEKKDIIIPPKTSKKIAEYKIVSAYYENCDLPRSPNPKKGGVAISFSKVNTPFDFYNSITYVVGRDTNISINKFYVSEVTNLPENLMFVPVAARNCGGKAYPKSNVLKYQGPDRFYIKYTP